MWGVGFLRLGVCALLTYRQTDRQTDRWLWRLCGLSSTCVGPVSVVRGVHRRGGIWGGYVLACWFAALAGSAGRAGCDGLGDLGRRGGVLGWVCGVGRGEGGGMGG